MATLRLLSTRVAHVAVIVAVAGAVAVACGTERPDAQNGEGRNGGPPPLCGTPNDGCPCDSPGTEVDCGMVKHQSGNHVACTMGKRVCLAGRWSACHGTHVVTKSVPGLGNTIHTAALTQGPCPPPPSPLANPCDPYCQQILDDGLITIPGGSGGGACAYYETADATASYSAINGGWKAIRGGNATEAGVCTTGTSDSCGHNSWCPTGAGCQFFTAGQKNTSCGGASWDLTFGTPCLGSTATMTICNRGNGPTPGAGTYWGVVEAIPLQGQPTDVSLCKADPTKVRGYCSIDFATTTINPGSCVSVATSTLCPGVDFTGSGAGGGDRTTIQWNMPDWPDPGCGNKPRVAGECIDKNNFTVLELNALLACQGVGCGGGAGGGPGAGVPVTLQTTANGTSACSPGPNVVTNPCNAGNQYTSCQQDHRCDIASGTCVWNGGEGWFDPAVAGVDLTVGAACETAGAEQIPVCNRGSGTVAAGTPINLHFPGPAVQPDSCIVPATPPACSANAPPSGLGPGKCMNIPCAIPGNKYAIVSGPAEAPGLCANNQAYVKTSGTAGCAACTLCSTRVSGKVFDPSAGLPTIATASNLPLSGITVYQPSGPLVPLVDGLACDSCTSTDSPAVLGVRAVTDAAGAFTLNNVTPGLATRIVVQSGRWRREISVPVTACVDNVLPPGTLRMPRNRTDGDGGVASIPKTAIIFGKNDPLQCLLLKLGISSSEIRPRTGPGDLHRFQVYRHPTDGGQNTVPAAPSSVTLHTGTTLAEYSQIISGCTSGGTGWSNHSAAQVDQIIDWAQAGGRAFVTHGTALTYVRNNPTAKGALFKSTGTGWDGDADKDKVKVVLGTPPQVTFRDWLVNVGASVTYGPGWITADPKGGFPTNVVPANKATEWLRGEETPDWVADPVGDSSVSFSFETPVDAVDCGTPQGTGRVFFNGMHTSGRSSGNTFPTNCNLGPALTPEEKALAFHYFQLGACTLGGAPPPPPPPPLVTTYVTRDYQGTCGVGEFPEWQFLYWQSITPPGTSIEFRAATAPTQATLPAAPPAAAPVTVAAGTATGATVVDPNWQSDANTIAWHLANDPPGPAQLSKQWLRVYVRMNPIGSVPPTVTALRVDYSCKPAE